MKQVGVLFLCIFLFSLLALPSDALSYYTDDLGALYNDHIKSYYNLSAVQNPSGEVVDANYATIGNPTLKRGGVTYRVKNAKSVQITLYASQGTQIIQAETGDYFLGTPEGAGGALTSIRPFYSPLYDQVYIQSIRGLESLAYTKEKGYFFAPTHQLPTDLQPYALQVQVSVDGKSFQRVPTTLVKTQFFPQNLLTLEEHTALIPPTAAFVKVEVNDIYQIPLSEGGSFFNTPQTMNKLARVTLLGANLDLGGPVHLQPETDPLKPSKEEQELKELREKEEQREKDAEKKKAADAKNKSDTEITGVPKATTSGGGVSTPKTVTEKTVPEGALPKTPTSKFEGSGAVLKTTPKIVLEPKEKPVASPSPSETGETVESLAPEEQVHVVEAAAPSTGLLSRGVNAYILIATGVLLSLFFRRKQD